MYIYQVIKGNNTYKWSDKMCARKYKETHPWITFNADFRKIDHKTWMLLGEAKSKCMRISNALLKPELSRTLYETYLAKGVHSTTAIEGNSLSEEEVKKRIEGTLRLPDSMQYQVKEVDNILDSYNYVREGSIDGGSAEISSEEIKNYNKMVLEGLHLSDDNIVGGEVRNYSLGVLGYRGAPEEDCEWLLDRMCEWLNDARFSQSEDRIAFAIIKAVLAHLYIAWIHPFGDGNGRTARLVELKIMLASGAPAPACHLLSNHYNKTRSEYYRQLDYASKSGGDIYKFIRYAVRGLVDQLEEQIEFIDFEQQKIFLRDYIFEAFGDKPGKINARRRTLCLGFLSPEGPVKIDKVKEINPKVAEQYSGKSIRTIQRDIEFLIEKKLVKEEQDGYMIDPETLFKFFP